jgi:branched-chain amino acid transport system ATP-binding protein
MENISAGYGAGQVLFDFSLTVPAGQAVAMMGRNGMGKTTAIRVIMGMLQPSAGTVRFCGQRLDTGPAHLAARAGIGLVPEGRRVFPTLTVEENLLATATSRHGSRWSLPAIYALFPRLRERRRQRAALLSGGEQQMLAIGRALMTNPRLLILDEATEGLAPLIRAEIFATLDLLRRAGESILIVDKHLQSLTNLVDALIVVLKGRVVWQGPPSRTAEAEHWLNI